MFSASYCDMGAESVFGRGWTTDICWRVRHIATAVQNLFSGSGNYGQFLNIVVRFECRTAEPVCWERVNYGHFLVS